MHSNVNILSSSLLMWCACFSSESSDPFVIIELNPKFMFGSVKTEKTSVHKATLDPVFSEDFKM